MRGATMKIVLLVFWHEKSSLVLTCVSCTVRHNLLFVLYNDSVSSWHYTALNDRLAGELERVWSESVVF